MVSIYNSQNIYTGLISFLILFTTCSKVQSWGCSNNINIPSFVAGSYGATKPLIITITSHKSETNTQKVTWVVNPPYTYVGYKADSIQFSCPTGMILVGPTNFVNTVACGVANEFPIPSVSQSWPVGPILPNGCAPVGGQGDPQLMGFQGQSYQFHGIPDEVFSIITTPYLQINSRFKYISNGNCEYNHTLCWTHPGTYINEFGLMIKDKDDVEYKFLVISQKYSKGLYAMANKQENNNSYSTRFNEKFSKIELNQVIECESFTIYHEDKNILEIETELFNFVIINSDEFFNFEVSLKNKAILNAGKHKTKITDESLVNQNYPNLPIHGLVGQTWKNIVYKDNKLYEGEVDDYLVSDLFGTKFRFNQY
jgi:hypothetical protein